MRQFICAIIAVLFMASAVSASSYDINARVSDGAGLLTASQAESLKSRINNVIDKYQFDIVIVTVKSLGGKTPEAYADDYYDYNGYGFGANHDGVLFLVSMEDRDWHVSTTGKGIEIITDARVSEISGKVIPYLSSGDYYGAFDKFISMTEWYLENPNTAEHTGKGSSIAIVWLAALIIALIAVFIMKAQLNTARPNPQAADYVKSGSFYLSNKRDLFINTITTRTARPKDTDSDSSTHTGSSGTSHGGGGGKF